MYPLRALLILLVLSGSLRSQNLDSLVSVYNKAKSDTNKIKLAFSICDKYFVTDPNEADPYINEALRIALKEKSKRFEAKCYLYRGNFFKKLDVQDTAIFFYQKSKRIFEELKDGMNIAKLAFSIATTKSNLGLTNEALHELDSISVYFEKVRDKEYAGMCYSNMAGIYDTKGEFTKGVELLLKAIKLFEACNKPDRVARAYNGLCNILRQKGDYKKAIFYGNEALKIRQQLGDKMGMGVTYTSLGNVYSEMNDPKNAIKYMRLSYQYYDEIGMKSGIGVVCNNLGLEYEDINVDSAIYFFKKSLEIKRQYTGHLGLAPSLVNLGQAYILKKDYAKALPAMKEALEISREISDLPTLRNTYEALSTCYSQMANYELAFKYQDSLVMMNDSMLSLESSKEISEMEALYQNEKKNLEISNLEKEKAISEKDIQRQNLFKLVYGIGFVFMLASVMVAYRSYVRKRKDNKLISQQKEILEERQKEILSSITYARYLQNAILPPPKLVRQYLPDSFIVFQPKDIVAGDFYWLQSVNDELLVAACDCTGHGVPGAMVSVVCSNALNRSVKEFKITEPGKLLDKVRELVLETFQKSNSDVKDGMDASLCTIVKQDVGSYTIKWSGANNPLWYIQAGEFKELKPDKQPIGKTDSPFPFTTHTIELKKEDSLYLFTDGFADQFGGSEGKKFKYKQFKDILVQTSKGSVEEQKEEIIKIFESWRGNIEQVDDVCIIGIRF